MTFYIENRHSGAGRDFAGTIEQTIESAKNECKRVGDAFAIYEQPSNRRIATVKLDGWKGGVWFDTWIHPAYQPKE